MGFRPSSTESATCRTYDTHHLRVGDGRTDDMSPSRTAPALAAAARIDARQALRQQGLRHVVSPGGCRIGDDAAAVFVEIDAQYREPAFAQNGRQRITRGLGEVALLAAARLHFGRIDPTQPYLGSDVEAWPQMHARLERVAVEHAQHIRRIGAFGGGPRLRTDRKVLLR